MSDWLWQCEAGCGRARRLLIEINGRRLCAACWRRAGCPSQAPAPETPEHLRAGHDKMLARGGEDRYRVLAGKA